MSESLDKIWDLIDAHTATIYFPDYVNIKNELKALEIIKNKISLHELNVKLTDEVAYFEGGYLTQEEFDFLKGVLKNE